jgi:hypothetical protein
MSSKLDQMQKYELARRSIAGANRLFLELIDHPTNPIKKADLAALIAMRPERWGRFAPWLEKLP